MPVPSPRAASLLAVPFLLLAAFAAAPAAACDAPACVTPTVPGPTGGTCVLAVAALDGPEQGLACTARDPAPSPGVVQACTYESHDPAAPSQAACVRTLSTGTFCAATVQPVPGQATYGVGCLLPAGPVSHTACAAARYEGTERTDYGCVAVPASPTDPSGACLVDVQPASGVPLPKLVCVGPSPLFLCPVRPPVGPSCLPGPVQRGLCAARMGSHDYACIDAEVDDYDHSRFCAARVTVEHEWGDTARAALCLGAP